MTKPINRQTIAEVAALMEPIWGPSEWREAVDFPRHFVSSLGLVWTCRSQKLVRGCVSGRGYRSIVLTSGPREYVHRIICRTFHGHPELGRDHVRHLDGNMDNNHADNLAWGSRQDNEADKERHGTVLRGDRCPASKLTSEKVREMRAIRARDGHSYSTLGRMFGVSHATAHRAVVGETWNV